MSDGWTLTYDGLDPAQVGLREALLTLGNGKFATRGAAEEQSANGIDYPGTYLAGVYNSLTSDVAGHQVVNDDLVNVTNWLWLTFRHEDGEWLDLWKQQVLEHRQVLHLREGTLERSFRVRDPAGRVTRIESRRIVHMEQPYLAAIEWRLRPENWSGPIVVRSGLDGSVVNANVARYRQLSSKHLEPMRCGPVAPEGIHLVARTGSSAIEVGAAARTRICGPRDAPDERRIIRDQPERIAEEIHVASRVCL
jgi:trehalose/maltose hydrolase-like predicted phosphorylase